MAEPRPSLTLVLNVDESVATKDMRLEVDRSFGYVGSTVLRAHAPEDGKPYVNTIDFLVRLGNRRYLRSSDAGADQLWDDVIERWLYNQFYTVGNQIEIFNRRQREIGNPELDFTYMNVNLENGALTVRTRLDSNGTVPPELSRTITRLRAAYNEGALGDAVVAVTMPSETSFAAQAASAAEEKAAREAAEAERAAAEAAQEAERAAAQAAVAAEPANNFTEAADLVEEEDDETERMRAQVEEKFALPEADFAIDYTQWTVVYADSSTRDFDSAQGAFVA
jgi:hypothetical protein